MEIKKYDLNVNDTMGDQWDVSDAIRELMSNAIDESIITSTKQPLYELKNNILKIRDWGRGIKPKHFINDKNSEKEQLENTIGIFGVGLKDSLNVLFNKGCKTSIFTKDSIFEVERNFKPNTNAETLFITQKKSNNIIDGTLIVIENVDQEQYQKAMEMFIHSKALDLVFENEYGEVLLPGGEVYLNGVLISKSDDLYYTYNITKPLKSMVSKMTRERKEINKTAYMPVIESLVNKFSSDDFRDWMQPYVENTYQLVNFEFSRSKFLKRYKSEFNNIISREQFDYLEQDKRNDLLNQGFLIVDRPGYDFDFHDEIVGEDHVSTLDESEKNNLIKVIGECKELKLPWVDIDSIHVADKINIRGHQASGLADHSQSKIILLKELFKKENYYLLFVVYVHEASHIISGFGDETRGFQNRLEENFTILLKEIFKKS